MPGHECDPGAEGLGGGKKTKTTHLHLRKTKNEFEA